MTHHVTAVNNFDISEAFIPLQRGGSASQSHILTQDLIEELDNLHTALRLNPAMDTDHLSKVHTLIRSALDAAGSLAVDHSGFLPSTGKRVDFSPGGLLGWQCRVVEKLMRDRLGEKLRVDDLARAVRLSPSYFTHAFRTTYGMPPKRFLMRLRIREAQKCLLADQTPLCELALQCGFSDQAHFTRVFHEVTGETPRRWLGLRLQPSARVAQPAT